MDNCTIPLKRCPKCGEEKPATPEYFHRNKYKRSGLVSRCKICVLARSHDQYMRNHEKFLAKGAEWRAANREKSREASRNWYNNNRERALENNRQWYINNRERARQNARNNRLSNLDRTRATNRRVSQTWRERHPEVKRNYTRRRRAIKRNLPATFNEHHEYAALDYFNGCCAVCSRQLRDLFATHTIAFDHWIPLSRGGGSTPENMIPLCHGENGCNNRKSGSDPVEWLNRNFKPAQVKAILKRINTYFEWIQEQDIDL